MIYISGEFIIYAFIKKNDFQWNKKKKKQWFIYLGPSTELGYESKLISTSDGYVVNDKMLKKSFKIHSASLKVK